MIDRRYARHVTSSEQSTPVGSPPVAKKVPHTWQRPTGAVDDPWAWLRDRDDPDTTGYLEAENVYASSWFAQHAELTETLFQEFKSRVQETDVSVPVFHGGWWYTGRTEEGLSYPIHCRGRTRETAAEQVVLDQNAEAGEREYFALGVYNPSPDHTLLAWASDNDGSENYTVRIRDMRTGVDLEDVLEATLASEGCAWSGDGSQFFYVMPDEQMRPFQVWRHAIGTTQAEDVLVHEELDERFFVGVEESRSLEWVIIGSSSKQSSEMWLIPSSDPEAIPTKVRAREDEVEYSIDHWGDCFVVLTNLDAEDFRVMTAPLDAPGEWTEILPHVAGQRITSLEPFADHLVVHEWAHAQQRLRILRRSGNIEVIDLGDEPHSVELHANPEWSTHALRYVYQSFTMPASIYDLDLVTGQRELLKRTPTPNLDLSRYTASREWATAEDGTLVPVDIVRRRDQAPDGTTPCLVYGYGSYEISMPPRLSLGRISLLDRGWTWALVHPRGGGELGRKWYREGKLLAKRNTFTDTVASIEHLVSSGWARRDGVVIRGGSAGGLLVGACMTMRPDLCRAVVAEVPFVDVVNTMSDPSLPLTVTEWEEWGDPRDEPYASYIASYSPYDNTVGADYPAIYITAGLNDPRVSYHEPAKWCAKLRAVRTSETPIVMKTEMGAGHGGPSGRYDSWRDESLVTTFCLVVAGGASD